MFGFRWWRSTGWVVLALTASIASPISAQENIVWSNVGTDWNAPASWVGGIVPTGNDSGFFLPNQFTPGTNPNVLPSTIVQLQNGMFANSPLLGNYTFTGGASSGLTLAAGGGNGTLFTRGIGTTTFDGPALIGNGATNLALLNLGAGTVLTLTGNSVLSTFTGTVTLQGGTLNLDSSSNIRITASNPVNIVGGAIALTGPGSGLVTNAGPLGTTTSNSGGLSTISVQGNNILQFANTGTFSLRGSTFQAYRFEAIDGVLGGGPSSPRITFAGNVTLASNGLIGNSANTPGCAIVSDAAGTQFASWSPSQGVFAPLPTLTAVNAAQLQTSLATDRVQFNPAPGVTTATGVVGGAAGSGSLRITPAPGAVLDMATFNLNIGPVMLDGSNDFAIAGSGVLASGATHYVYVNDPNTMLTTSLVIATSGGPFNMVGPGFLTLNSTSSQNTLGPTNRMTILGGTLRANDTQIGLTGAGAGAIVFGGGVLEIQNGTNGTGAAADFRRPLGSGVAGVVNWDAGGANGRSSGGFSAFGSAASVNIGGNSTPDPLRWGQNGFVQDGYALIFGSTKSNALLTFHNPLQLDPAVASPYQAREIRVIGGVGGDATVMAGPISGTASADLIKTGTGTLVFPSAVTHTYAGNTYVAQGTLQVNGTMSNTGGAVVVGAGLGSSGMLSGVGTINRPVLVQAGGTIKPGNSPGQLTVGTAVTMQDGSTHAFQYTTPVMSAPFNSGGSATAGTGNNLLTVTGTLDVQPGAILKITGNFSDFTLGQDYSFLVATGMPVNSFSFNNTVNPTQFDTSELIGFNPASFLQWQSVGGSVYFNMTPVPEPVHILLMCGGLAVGAQWVLRRKAKG